MGASGQGDPGDHQDVDAVRREVRKLLRRPGLDAELNWFLAAQVATFENRDTELAQRRIDAIEEALGNAVNVERLLFGGSVAKHTYVDGLSDIDALVVLHEPAASPHDLVIRFTKALRGRLGRGDVLGVSAGRLAATVTYRDGSQIQLLPAVERDGQVAIASLANASWRYIRPLAFAAKLVEVNEANGRAVVPTIKLAKAAIQGLPEGRRLSGYHIEAIAVAAFTDYRGSRDRVSMLQHLISHATQAVLQPTRDVTGESDHIDAHLGPADSAERWAVSASLRRLAAQLSNATSVRDYRNLIR
jgi:predicted nucleotidyltransferase